MFVNMRKDNYLCGHCCQRVVFAPCGSEAEKKYTVKIFFMVLVFKVGVPKS